MPPGSRESRLTAGGLVMRGGVVTRRARLGGATRASARAAVRVVGFMLELPSVRQHADALI